MIDSNQSRDWFLDSSERRLHIIQVWRTTKLAKFLANIKNSLYRHENIHQLQLNYQIFDFIYTVLYSETQTTTSRQTDDPGKCTDLTS